MAEIEAVAPRKGRLVQFSGDNEEVFDRNLREVPPQSLTHSQLAFLEILDLFNDFEHTDVVRGFVKALEVASNVDN